MSAMAAILLAATIAAAPAPPHDATDVPSDAQIIVVEVPPSARQSPAPTASSSSRPTPSAAVPASPRSDLPATGWDAATLAVAAVIGAAALAVGILVRRRRRPGA